ncbi:MAG: hypothetical protein RLZZ536_358, partial [Planctomycetota bacterium]
VVMGWWRGYVAVVVWCCVSVVCRVGFGGDAGLQIVTASRTTPEYTRRSEGDVIELSDGRLLLVSMEFSGDGSDFAKTRLVAQESADGGLTWGQHRVVTETADGDMNVYSPNLIAARDGGVLLLFMRQHRAGELTNHVWKSRDDGATFVPYSEFVPRGDFSLCNATVKRLASGRLLLPANPPVPGQRAETGPYAATVLWSDDDGLTWSVSESRVQLPLRGAMEPHVEQTADGRVLMVLRNQLGRLYMSESVDDGVSWSTARPTDLISPESCPELTRIPGTDDLLMIWNNSFDPKFRSHFGRRSPLTAAVSRDGGRSWQNVRDIETDQARAFSNPGCRFTRSGKAIVNYWTCEYLADWRMQDVIDLRVAVIDRSWFYGAGTEAAAGPAGAVVQREIGSRRELFVDRFLIERMRDLELRLQQPVLAEPTTEPADAMEYGTVIRDGDLFRLYTRDGRGAKFDGDEPEVTRYCESRDGVHWTKPKLGLVEVDGSRENNVILKEAPYCHNFSPFLDVRPGVPAEERFKALGGTVKTGLAAFVSGDGIRWRKLRSEPVITYTKEYAFDSQNVAFWSESEGQYVCYFRHFLEGQLRSVCRTTSSDFVNWSEPVPLRPNFPGEHIYTSLTQPYFRAPHLYVATPTRFHPGRGESTDILFMTARGSSHYDRTFREAWIRPGLDPARWGNRSNYAALNVQQTGAAEMSVYVTPFRRFVLRLDGFASLHAGADGGEMTTWPLVFAGKRLFLNYATSAGGSVRGELRNAAGEPLPGFGLADCKSLVGDEIEGQMEWPGGDLTQWVGQPVRLHLELQEADVYALQFRD